MKYYIVRKCVFATLTGARDIYDEAICSSYKLAVQHIGAMGLEDEKDFFFEILELPLDSYSAEQQPQKWFFDNFGQEISCIDNCTQTKICIKTAGTAFHIGDYVLIKAFPQSDDALLFKEVLGVISDIANSHLTNTPLTVAFIGDDGSLDHVHPCFHHLEKWEQSIPPQKQFLSVFRDYLLGKRKVSQSTLKAIRKGEVALNKSKILDWGQNVEIVKF